MTEYELIEVSLASLEGLGYAGMNIVAVVFAYVVAAHFVGKKLSRAAAVCLSIVYSLWLIGPSIGFIRHLELTITTATEYLRLFPNGYAAEQPGNFVTSLILVYGPYFMGWIGSLIFMHLYIRKSNGHTANSDT